MRARRGARRILRAEHGIKGLHCSIEFVTKTCRDPPPNAAGLPRPKMAGADALARPPAATVEATEMTVASLCL